MGLIWIISAAFWGVAEATIFFIVPDVLLTAAVIRFGFHRALLLAVVAAGFAALAGLAMWTWGHGDADAARRVMLMVPAIGPDLLTRAHDEMASGWVTHLFTGAVTGLPYKLYAVEAGVRGINPLLFLLVSFVARLPRFLLSMALAALGSEVLARIKKLNWAYPVWALGWTALYAVYFTLRA